MAPQLSHGRVIGWVLVGIQMALFAFIVLAAGGPRIGPQWWGSLPVGGVLVAGGVVIVGFAARHLGSALTPHPSPNGVGLRAEGIYRLMRHPMYTGVWITFLGCAAATGRAAAYGTVAVLAVLFEVKSRLEERYLVATYDGYEGYAAETGKFVPGVAKRRAG